MEKKSPKRVTDAKEKTKEIINKEIGRKANKKNQTMKMSSCVSVEPWPWGCSRQAGAPESDGRPPAAAPRDSEGW